MGAALDPLSVGLTGWFVIEERQKTGAHPLGLHLAQDAVTAYATQRGLLVHRVYLSSKGSHVLLYSGA